MGHLTKKLWRCRHCGGQTRHLDWQTKRPFALSYGITDDSCAGSTPFNCATRYFQLHTIRISFSSALGREKPLRNLPSNSVSIRVCALETKAVSWGTSWSWKRG